MRDVSTLQVECSERLTRMMTARNFQNRQYFCRRTPLFFWWSTLESVGNRQGTAISHIGDKSSIPRHRNRYFRRQFLSIYITPSSANRDYCGFRYFGCACDPAHIETRWVSALYLVSTPAHGVEDPFFSKPVCFVRPKPGFYELVERGLHYLPCKRRRLKRRRSATEKVVILLLL